MKTRYLIALLAMMPCAATAAVDYRAQLVKSPAPTAQDGRDAEAFARQKRFYAGAMYNFAIWQSGTDGDVHTGGRNTSSFEGVIGVRPYDIFRIEANYLRTDAKWNAFSLRGDTVFVNALFDARMDNIYRIFRSQRVVPYVGAGAGLSWNKGTDAHLGRKISAVAAALAGVGFELGETVTLDFGYRYFYMFKPEFDTMPQFAPSAHQFRAGVRVNF